MKPELYTFFQVHVVPFIWALGLVFAGFLIGRLVSSSVTKTFIKHMTPQQTMLVRRIIFYFILILFVTSAFEQLGFQISTLLGAAGIITVAIGIASQTSMSNIVSGIFMIGEKPFEIGDAVKIGELSGEILSIDLLSVRIRTQENTMLRIPNEMIIKTSIVNLSYFPIRRFDMKMVIPYKEDLQKVNEILMQVATINPLSLIDPKPQMQILGFASAGMEVQFSVWAARQHYNDLRNAIQLEIKQAFDKNQIGHVGSEGLSVRLLSDSIKKYTDTGQS